MRPDYLNLIFLCLPPIAAVGLVWRFHPTRQDLVNNWLGQLLMGLIGAIFFFVQTFGTGIHKCMVGQPNTHIAAGIISATVVMFGTRYGAKRILSGILMLILIQISIQHYHHLVHGAGFLGVPELRSMHVDEQELPPTKAAHLWHTPLTRLYKLPNTTQETQQSIRQVSSEAAASASPDEPSM